jgi:hypothetical protein
MVTTGNNSELANNIASGSSHFSDIWNRLSDMTAVMTDQKPILHITQTAIMAVL